MNNFQTLSYQYYRKQNSCEKKKNNALKYLSFIHKPELRFHYRFLSVQHQTKKWSFENLPPFDLVYAFLSRSFRFFSHFWPVVWHLWRFISALITATCNSAAKHQLHIEFFLEMLRWESVPRGFSARALKLSSRLFSRPDWPPLGLRGWRSLGWRRGENWRVNCVTVEGGFQ